MALQLLHPALLSPKAQLVSREGGERDPKATRLKARLGEAGCKATGERKKRGEKGGPDNSNGWKCRMKERRCRIKVS